MAQAWPCPCMGSGPGPLHPPQRSLPWHGASSARGRFRLRMPPAAASPGSCRSAPCASWMLRRARAGWRTGPIVAAHRSLFRPWLGCRRAFAPRCCRSSTSLLYVLSVINPPCDILSQHLYPLASMMRTPHLPLLLTTPLSMVNSSCATPRGPDWQGLGSVNRELPRAFDDLTCGSYGSSLGIFDEEKLHNKNSASYTHP
jgi:hypothetical protein